MEDIVRLLEYVHQTQTMSFASCPFLGRVKEEEGLTIPFDEDFPCVSWKTLVLLSPSTPLPSCSSTPLDYCCKRMKTHEMFWK